MKSKYKLLSLLSVFAVNSVMASSIYELQGDGINIGNISINNNRPVSSMGYNFTPYTMLNGQVYTGNDMILVGNNITTGIINTPNWDFTSRGDLNIGGSINCSNLNIGFQGTLSN